MSQQAALTPAPAGMDLTKVSRPFPGWTPAATEYELALLLRLGKTYRQDPFRQELVLERRRRRRQWL